MDRGLYVAAAGMRAEQVRQDQISADLANAATPGYKRDRTTQTSFGDLLLQNTRTRETVGPVGLGPYADATVTDLRGQTARVTGEPLDFAVAGDGFFSVQTPTGVRYTRNGQFSTAADGRLVDGQGNQVLGRDGGPITVPADGKVDPGRLALVAVDGATKQGEGLFAGTAAGAGTGTIQQGSLEASGVDATRAMVEMISSLRAFEAGQKSITTIDETLAKASQQVGSTTN